MSSHLIRLRALVSRRRVQTAGTLLVVTFLVGAAFAQPNSTATQNPPPAAIVDKPLPPPTNDTPDEAPSPQHVWVPGHWRWSQGSYMWVAGRWQLPPVQNAQWVPPEWDPSGSGYVLRDGYWKEGVPPANVPAPTQPPKEISTAQPPPPPRSEVIPEQPSAAYAWEPGYWDWRDNQFVWVNGHWEMPPRENLAWVPTHWETRGDRYVLVSGYWRENTVVTSAGPASSDISEPSAVATTAPTPTTQVVITQAPPSQPQIIAVAPPPAPPVETMYARPSPYHTWVPGYWAWRAGRYVWIAGHWERPPRGRHAWDAPRWERRGGTYVFIEGHWR